MGPSRVTACPCLPTCLRADIEVRLLLSISREQSYDKAMETVQLAARLRGRGVLGVGLTGNPSVGEVREGGARGGPAAALYALGTERLG